jgi:para-nitrobenzyl esterase
MNAILTITYGKLAGFEQDRLVVFKGIPFATPPVGSRRWLPPQKPSAWNGTRDARNFGAASPQLRLPSVVLGGMQIEEAQSEDCLYLNVWTPNADNKRRPVMVWIHGGAFRIGSGAQVIYDGSSLARRGDVVVVTINYRMGPFGFIRLTDITNGKIAATGNEGLLDQIAALEWVRDNIAQFGGDPANVTVFGESAGGMSIGALLAMPAARGLFHKAILQSGFCHSGRPAERANRYAEKLIGHTGADASKPDSIGSLTTDQLLKATLLPDGITEDPELGMAAYQLVVDGAHLPEIPIGYVARGSASAVPLLVGSTLDELKLFTVVDPGNAKLDQDQLERRMGRALGAEAASRLIASYQHARGSRGEPDNALEILSALETDRVFRIPAIKLVEAQFPHQPRVFNYLFTWKSPVMGGALGSCHALELGFVFGTHAAPTMQQFSGVGPQADKLSIEMQDAWLSFARSGDPGWAPYTSSRRTTMLFGEKSAPVDAPRDEERRAWNGVPEGVLGTLSL